MGVTCESITLGHNPSKLPLTANNVVLPRQRPLFFSEHVVEVFNVDAAQKEAAELSGMSSMSAAALMGTLTGLKLVAADADDNGINDVFDEVIEKEEALKAAREARGDPPPEIAPGEEPAVYRQIPPLRGQFIGAWMAYDARYRGMSNQELMDKQFFIQNMYETRIASLHRFVAFAVMFHEMARRVERFWYVVSGGLLAYDMSRTQSIMRIATTASPVSGMEVREKTIEQAEETAQKWAENVMQLVTAKWYCFTAKNAIHHPEKVQSMLKILYSEGGSKYMQQNLGGGTSRVGGKKTKGSRGGGASSRSSPGTVRSRSASKSDRSPSFKEGPASAAAAPQQLSA